MKEYYLGGDVSKGYCDFLILDKSNRIVEKNFQLDDTPGGHNLLINKIRSLLESNPQSVLYGGFESTGGYENNWLHLLKKLSSTHNVKVARLNSKGVSYHHKASLNRNITDPISAKNIAQYLITYPSKANYNQETLYQDARSLYGHIEMLTKQNTQQLNVLESELYRSNPSLMCYWKDEMPDWLLAVIRKWPTAEALSQASVAKIALIPYVSKERAKELKKNAQISVASAASQVMATAIESMATQLIQNREVIKKRKKDLYRLCPLPEVEILKSMPSISDYTAYGVILEIDGIERFANAKKLCSYFGVHPVYKDSGDGVWGYHMSKQGRRRPRRLLYMSAMNAVKRDPVFKELYEKHTGAGRTGRDALCIVMHKMVRIIYSLLTNRCKYDPRINQMHRAKYEENKKGNKTRKVDSSRRFQMYDDRAPISGRQNKKRHEIDKENENITSNYFEKSASGT